MAVATLAVAALFQPARRRTQHAVDRRFNRRRYDATRTIDAFSLRLRDQVDLDTLTAELLAVVNLTMEPTHTSLWLDLPLPPSAAPSGADGATTVLCGSHGLGVATGHRSSIFGVPGGLVPFVTILGRCRCRLLAMMPDKAAAPGSRAWAASAVALASIVLAALALLLFPAQEHQELLRFLVASGGNALIIAACTTVGLLIVTRRRGNVIGWTYLLLSLAYAVGEFTGAYALRAQTRSPPLPAGVWAAWITDPLWIAAVPLGGILLLLLFPTGQPPSPRWRLVTRVAAIAGLIAGLASALHPDALHKYLPSARNPAGIQNAGPLLDVVLLLAGVVLVACLVAAVASLLVRWRRARGIERQQLKWLADAAVLLLIVLAAGSFLPHLLYQAVVLVAALLLPTATGTAVLRYRLYDIDRVINRTLVYGLLTALLLGVYAAGVTAIGGLLNPLGGRSSLAVAASTLAVAALFQPARRRIQTSVDRRFNRRRYDAAEAVAAFSARLRDQVDLDTLTAELLAVVDQTMEPTRLSLWLRPSSTATPSSSAARSFPSAAPAPGPAATPIRSS